MAQFNFPQVGDIVIATVKKTTTFGAFLSLDEFDGQDAFVHVSELSSGWVRNVRDHVKEAQKIVAVVLRVDMEKRQIDLSLKRISEVEKKRKMEAYNVDKRAAKLLVRVASKINKKPADAVALGEVLKKEYGDLYTAFELASEGKELSEKIPVDWIKGIVEVAKVEIKPKRVTQRQVFKLKSFSPNGVILIKATVAGVLALSTKDVEVQVHYLGAPKYSFDVTASDYKTAEKGFAKIKQVLAGVKNVEYEIQEDAKK